MGQPFKACFYKKKELNSQRVVVYTTNMDAVSLCWNINMAVLTYV